MEKQETLTTCAICQTEFQDSIDIASCPECQTRYHAECWEENQGCAIYGCPCVPEMEPLESMEVPVSYWGQEDKECPSCGERILAAAVRCRFCGQVFTSAKPMDRNELHAESRYDKLLPKTKRTVVVMFLLSIFPVTAPVFLFVDIIWYMLNKEKINRLPVMYKGITKLNIFVSLFMTGMCLIIFILLYFFA